MRQAFKYKLYPSRAQAKAMGAMLETHRRLYNRALGERKDAYENQGRTVRYGEQSAQLKVERQTNPFLASTNFSSCQATLRRLDKAFQAFFCRVKACRVKAGEKAGYPRFRGQSRYDSVEFPAYGDGCKLKGSKLYLQRIGDVKIKLHRKVEGTIKTVRFKREADGWHVVFSCELPDIEVEDSSLPEVGIDLGLKSFLVTSAGEAVATPQFYRKAQAKLRRAQRTVARRKKGGSNRRKAVRQLQRQHQHIAHQRRDFHHKTARSLVEKHGAIAHEKLNVTGIARTRLAKSTQDAGWAQFLAILKHKAECAGVKTIAVNPRYTTQTCSNCGCLPPVPLTLRDRVYHCTSCHHICDRDLNAAVNILKAARTEPSGANASVVMLGVA